MTEFDDALLLDHEADGIRELDNRLPRWWVWLFYATIIFSVFYMGYYHVFGLGHLMAAEYEKEMVVGNRIKEASMAKFESAIDALQPSSDAFVVGRGQQLYAQLCAPCHRADAGGLVGPNLTDDYWIHGGGFADNLRIVWNGVPAKGMVAWKGVLKPDEIVAVASYIYTLRGSNPPNAKPPESLGASQPAENLYE